MRPWIGVAARAWHVRVTIATMSSSTLAHVGKAHRGQTAERLWASRDLIHSAAERRKLGQVRVFGSVARGDEGAHSDLDLLVCPAHDASLFDLAGSLTRFSGHLS